MEQISEIVTYSDWTVARTIASILFLLVDALLVYIVVVKRKEFWKGIAGKDGIPQPVEIATMVWLFVFTILAQADVALGLHASSEFLELITWIGTVTIFSAAGKEVFKKDKNGNPTE